MKKLIIFLFLISLFSCATVSDSVVSAITDEQYEKLNYIYTLIQDYSLLKNEHSLDIAKNELEEIDLDSIYNSDYKSKVLGLKALTEFYKNNKLSAKSIIKDVNRDEELFWVVTSLLEKNPDEKLSILTEAKETLYSSEILNDFLADVYMENVMYGEAAATYDTILLTEEYYIKEYEAKRDIAFLFMQNPPTNTESALIVSKNIIVIQDLIDLIDIETTYFSSIDKKNIYKTLQDRDFFINELLNGEKKVQRKDLAYFLFALMADRNKNLNLWSQYKEFFDPDITQSEKIELSDMSPIKDVPIYEYYFYPSLFLIEEEVMKLPDGENFYPYNNVSGIQLQSIITNLKKRVD